MWVLGDNRYDSADSRFHLNSESGGFVPIENVVGRAFVTVWPFDRIGLVPKMANTYIPDATAVTP
jgi:signal peptidase I